MKRLLSVVLASAAVAIVVATTATARTSGTIVLRGADSQNLAPFRLSRDADVLWSCPGCGDANFIFSTDSDIPVNALGHTHGVSFLAKGRYTGVNVIGSGSWKITLRPAAKRPVARSYVLTGVDSQNLRPFTLTHDSRLSWSCPGCGSSNFIVSTNEDIPVNALNRRSGSSFLGKGRYTGVSVTGSGNWRIVIR